MRLSSLVLTIALMFAGCRTPSGRPDQSSDVKQFFKNSYRRDPTAEELRSMVKTSTGCTAFFVKNSTGKTLLGTARHCTAGAGGLQQWCDTKAGFRVNEDKGNLLSALGELGQCKAIAVAADNYDIVLIEAEFPGTTLADDRGLSLAAYAPKAFTKLTMTGYPADPSRAGRGSATDGCWILSQDAGTTLFFKDPSGLHNCSTYGGNSGGPMLREGSRDVLGLPFTYDPNPATQLEPESLDTAAKIAKMSGFVSLHAARLQELGVAIVLEQPEPSPLTWSEVVGTDAVSIPQLGIDVVTRQGDGGIKVVEVDSIASTAWASASGLKVGDVITTLGKRPIYSTESMRRTLAETVSGTKVSVAALTKSATGRLYSRVVVSLSGSVGYSVEAVSLSGNFQSFGETTVADEELSLPEVGLTLANSTQVVESGGFALQGGGEGPVNYLIVKAVTEGSVAAQAGIQAGEKIYSFGLNVRDIKRSLEDFPDGTAFQWVVLAGAANLPSPAGISYVNVRKIDATHFELLQAGGA